MVRILPPPKLNIDQEPRIAVILLELAQADGKFCELYHAEDWDEFTAYDIFINKAVPFSTHDKRFIKIRNKGIGLYQSESRRYNTQLDRHRLKVARDFPPKWIKTNKGIWENLHEKKNRFFLPLYEFLMESRITPGEKGTPVFVLPDYGRIEQELKMKKRDVERYLRAMEAWDIITKTHYRNGERGPYFYSLGIWMQGKNSTSRPIYFLKESPEIKYALLHFDASKFH